MHKREIKRYVPEAVHLHVPFLPSSVTPYKWKKQTREPVTEEITDVILTPPY